MKYTSLKIKILSVMLAAGIAFSGTSFAFATDNNIENEKVATSINFKHSATDKKADKAHRAEKKATLQIVIKECVTSNIITKVEGDKVLEYARAKSEKNHTEYKKHKTGEKRKCNGTKGGLFNELVTEGILTKEKSDAIREKMYVKRTEIKTVELKNGLKTLVVKKIITNEQSNKVQQIMITRQTQRKEIYKKMQNMSEKERQEYMKKTDNTKVNPMKVLIDNGTITKEQETEIQKVLPHHNHGHRGHGVK